MNFLSNIHGKQMTLKNQIKNTVLIMILGIALGVFSKFLDNTPVNKFPFIFEYLDIRNFLGRFAFWLMMGLCIASRSNTVIRAGINVFVFFAGMVVSYYLYSKFAAGFFPKSYAAVWAVFTLISPLPAIFCRYAKENGKVPLIISAIILAVIFNTVFIYGTFYFEIRSVLELAVFAVSVIIMKRTTIARTALMLAMTLVFAFILNLVIPFNFG